MSNGGFQNVSFLYSATPTIPNQDDPSKSCSLVALCEDDDGCCIPDCVYEVDNDCDPATARDPGPAGCASGGTADGRAGLLILLAVAAALRRRRS
jgi:MYXO-CTERM domain-containing protein